MFNVYQIEKIVKAILIEADVHHGFSHAYRVSQIARMINEEEKGDLLILQTAALFHDVGLCYGREYHEVSSANIAINELLKINAAQYFVDKVAECIVSHRSHLNPKTIEARILWDADKLDRLIISRHADLLFAEAAGKDISIIYYQALGDLRNLRVRLHFEQSRKFHDLLFKQLECFLRDNKLEPYLLTRNLLLPGIIAPCDLGDANKWLGQANHALDMDNFCA